MLGTGGDLFSSKKSVSAFLKNTVLSTRYVIQLSKYFMLMLSKMENKVSNWIRFFLVHASVLH